MSKHTEGPWEARQSVRGYWFIEHQQGGEAYTLTKLDCSEADSRLIAASPELLAAAEAALGELEGYESAKQTVEKLYDAIRKATGEQL